MGIALVAAMVAAQPLTTAAQAPTTAFAISAGPSGHDASSRLPAAAEAHPTAYGFLEFDWAGGIPGFGPVPDEPARLALADTGR